jgi:hypothetical protein
VRIATGLINGHIDDFSKSLLVRPSRKVKRETASIEGEGRRVGGRERKKEERAHSSKVLSWYYSIISMFFHIDRLLFRDKLFSFV